jgi:hypothetical protein
LSALLNGKDSATTKKGNNFTWQNYCSRCGPVLGLLPKDTATVNGYFKDKMLKIY